MPSNYAAECKAAYDAVKRCDGNISEAARVLGLPRKTCANRYHLHEQEPEESEPKAEGASKKVHQSGDEIAIEYHGRDLRTPEELIADSDIDLDLWEVVDITVNQWETGGKRSQGQDENKKWQADKLWKMPLRQIKVRLKRKAPKPIQDGIRALLAELHKKPVKLPAVSRKRVADPHMLEISLYDAHFGKLCWGMETGTPYDLEIAKNDYVGAIDDLLNKSRGIEFDKILLPVGHDFFQVNNWLGTTVKGTVVDSVDDRFQKVFRIGCSAVEYAIRRCREIADVEVVWVPGNHDLETSWYLVEWLAAVFRGDKRVEVDNSPSGRKYRLYGRSLLGMTHGEKAKLRELPLIMAAEVPDLWAQSTERTWHTGHRHKQAVETYNGVTVCTIPSISGTDSWHHGQGFVGNSRAAEAYVWGKASGFYGQFYATARSSRGAA